ncbi:MAG: metal ABC transporter substrate-binding protein [Candidatus Methylomirabilales bacterium]
MRATPTLFALLLAAGCAGPSGPSRPSGTPDEGKLAVLTTVSPITNVIENVGGELISLTGLVPEGLNSHTFEPAPSDARLLASADLIFINGLNLEEPTRRLAEANLAPGARIVQLAERTITREERIFDFSFPEAGGDPNPHLWTNPLYAGRFSEIVSKELSKADPANAPRYRANQAAFAGKVAVLDQAVRAASASLRPERRRLLTYHDSFPYFAREYGWTIVGAIQPSDFSEPSPRELAALIEQVRQEKVPAIFGSEVFPSPVLKQIAAETGASYVDDLRDDDLPGEPGDPDHTYLGLMRFDFVTIVEALGGNASELKELDVSNVANGRARYRS